MKIQIRQNCYETNSSSTHSVTFSCNKPEYEELTIERDADNKLIVGLGDFCWGLERLVSQRAKLSYLLTMAMVTEVRETSLDEPCRCSRDITDISQPSTTRFQNTDGFKMLDAWAKSHGAAGISLAGVRVEYRKYNSCDEYYVDSNGAIDHQSCEWVKSLSHWLECKRATVDDIVLNKCCIIEIANDNEICPMDDEYYDEDYEEPEWTEL